MPLKIVRNDIAKEQADAIVNTANPEPTYMTGTDRAIYMAAGEEKLLKARKKIGKIAPGEVGVTKAYKLKAKYIIHAVGPVWVDGNHDEERILESCYKNALLEASKLNCKSIAFPLLSAGVNGFPKDKSLSIAISAISDFLIKEEMLVKLVVFDKQAFTLSEKIFSDVDEYIDEHYVDEIHKFEYYMSEERMMFSRAERYRNFDTGELPNLANYECEAENAELELTPEPELTPETEYAPAPKPAPPVSQAPFSAAGPMPQAPVSAARSLARPKAQSFMGALSAPAPAVAGKRKLAIDFDEIDRALSEGSASFQAQLFKLIDDRGLSDSDVYKRANLDRKLFSKIRCNSDYVPKKKTAVALALALGLSLNETEDLLSRAGLALSASNKFDLAIRYFINQGYYNIFEINNYLFDRDLPTLD